MCGDLPHDHLAFETPPGGIMTDEVGTITGGVEAWIEGDRVRIRYEGAAEVYTVTGSLRGRELPDIAPLLVDDPGADEYDNPRTISLD